MNVSALPPVGHFAEGLLTITEQLTLKDTPAGQYLQNSQLNQTLDYSSLFKS